MHLFVVLYIFVYECAEPTSVTTELILMCSANRTAAVFTATSQESPLFGTDPSGLWQFSQVSLAFLD